MREFVEIWNNPLKPLWLGAEQIEKMCNEGNGNEKETPLA